MLQYFFLTNESSSVTLIPYVGNIDFATLIVSGLNTSSQNNRLFIKSRHTNEISSYIKDKAQLQYKAEDALMPTESPT